MPRQFVSETGWIDVQSMQFHVFCDASPSTYVLGFVEESKTHCIICNI